jgi:hypothetical protein
MKKLPILLFFIIILSCSIDEYKQLKNGNIVSPNKTEYTFLADEGKYIVFGEKSFISHIRWQPRKLRHLDGNTDAGVYSCNNDPNLTILYRIKYNSEWSEIFIKKELSGKNYSLENCNSFKFFDTKNPFYGYYFPSVDYLDVNIGISNNDDINEFLEEINNNEIFMDKTIVILYNPFDIMAGNNGFIGFVYGFFHDIPNLAFPGTVWINDDRQFYLVMDERVFNISINCLKKLGYSE